MQHRHTLNLIENLISHFLRNQQAANVSQTDRDPPVLPVLYLGTFRAATNAQTPCTTAAPEVSPRPVKAPGAILPDSPITMPPPEEECPQPVPPLSRLSTNSTTVCCYVVFICPGLLHCIGLDIG